jgi:hypothetical protein
VFNRVRNHKNAHDLWMDICALHEGTRSEREERYHIAMRKLNSFEMLANENANAMYSLLGPCFVAEGPAGRNTFGKTCLYVIPKLPLMKLRYYTVSEGEGSNRLKHGMTF